MSEMDKQLPAILVEPVPTEEDKVWAQKNKKPWDRTLRKLMFTAVDDNNFWRVKYLFDNFSDRINVDYYYDRKEKDHGFYYKDSLASIALYNDNFEMFNYLLDKGATRVGADYVGEAVMWALNNRPSKFINELVDRFKDDLDLPGLFVKAVIREKTGIIDKFIDEFGYDINSNDPNPLFIAAENSAVGSAKHLLEKGADPTVLDGAILLRAKLNGLTELVPLLKDYAEKLGKEIPTPQEAQPKTIQDGTNYQKLSDVELLETRKMPDNGFCLTTIFNFETREIIRTQYLGGENTPPAIHVRNFGDLENQESLKKAFDQLFELEGNPPALDNAKRASAPINFPTKQQVS